MKKIVFTGIILVLVMAFAVTCDTPAVEEVEYTDVVYAPDGSKVTLYLDGVGVPVTPAQRAINRDLATMAFDYFEVIFCGTSSTTTGTSPNLTNAAYARTNWELGHPAGIVGVPLNVDYGYTDTKASASPALNIACMFVGKKSDKTLLGIGFMTGTTYEGTTAPATVTTVDSNTRSVMFEIAAIQTGLAIGGETPGTAPAGKIQSFKYVAGGVSGFTSIGTTNSTRAAILGSPLSYPRYALPTSGNVNATYEFQHVNAETPFTGSGTSGLFKAARVIYTTTGYFKDHPFIQKRVPRFMNGGRYMEPKEVWTSTTSVNFYNITSPTGVTNYTPTTAGNSTSLNNASFGSIIGLQFVSGGTGVFSFYIQVPVYMLSTNIAGYNTPAVPAQKWFIRTGVGSELYSLDDGTSSGGCVFMGIGSNTSTWIDIEWKWID